MNGKTMFQWALAAFMSIGLAQGQSTTVSYRRVLSAGERREYYEGGGRKWLGSLVHVHVKASVFGHETAHGTKGRPDHLLEFTDRSVPILVGRDSEYLAQLRRKTGRGHRGTICVKGRIVSPSWAPEGKCFLLADTLKHAPGREGSDATPRTSSGAPHGRRRAT
ncbi:MAG: hypothetical protein HYR85_00520 [Planctomycetes bacterium]|nr:hypothetical protein [Planctomycetota bacterium]MBI3847530.1 hypothetical protein [Planctomycetota bacterium]